MLYITNQLNRSIQDTNNAIGSIIDQLQDQLNNGKLTMASQEISAHIDLLYGQIDLLKKLNLAISTKVKEISAKN